MSVPTYSKEKCLTGTHFIHCQRYEQWFLLRLSPLNPYTPKYKVSKLNLWNILCLNFIPVQKLILMTLILCHFIVSYTKPISIDSQNIQYISLIKFKTWNSSNPHCLWKCDFIVRSKAFASKQIARCRWVKIYYD